MPKRINYPFGIGILLVLALPFVIACASSAPDSASNQDSAHREETAAPETPSLIGADNALQSDNSTLDTPPVNDSLPLEPPQQQIHTIEIPSSWVRIGKQEEIWIDTNAKEVMIAGTVCLKEGPLEMFICPQGTKEHESVISANALASQVHAALIALGFDPGKPTAWDPEYRAASGPTIDITVIWLDATTDREISMPAKKWIRNAKTRKPMEYQWVFGGSEFWQDPDTGEEVYYGDSGELVCLSNFSTATIDVNVQSSESNAGLLFEAFSENIPPIGTKVYAVLKPGKRIKPNENPAKSSGSVTGPGSEQ